MVRIRGAARQKEKKQEPEMLCGDCEEATPLTGDHLSVRDRRPLLATCRHRKHMVLLSESACKEHFKKREDTK